MRAAKAGVLTVCLLVWAAVVPAHAAGPNKREAEGRKHARKANQLADVNKCKLAIPEYTKAIRLLKDPTLLFNRAECYRRTGESAKAVADYRRFLVQLPSTPNRAQVEGQIAALDKKWVPVAAAVAAAAKPASKPPSVRDVPPTPPVAEPASSAPVSSAPVVEERRPVEPEVPERELAAPPAASAPTAAPSLVDTPGPMALVDTRATSSSAADSEPRSSSYWWIWVLGAVVLVGAGAGTYFALKQGGGTEIPSSALGNFKF